MAHPIDNRAPGDVYLTKQNIQRDDLYPPQDLGAHIFVAKGRDYSVALDAVVALDEPAANAVYVNGIPSAAGSVDTGNLVAGAYRFRARLKSAGAYVAATGIELVHRNAADAADIEVIANAPRGSELYIEGETTVQANESLVVRANSGGAVIGVEVDLIVEKV